MEAYRTKCLNERCGFERTWVGYKTGIGKTDAELAQMKQNQTVCKLCGGPAKTMLDERGLVGAVDAQAEDERKREQLIANICQLTGMDRDEVLTDALTLLGYAVVRVARGRTIASIDEPGNKAQEVKLRAFDKAVELAKKRGQK